MRKVIIVQARMASTRLPGKVMRDIAGQPMLAQQLCRLKRCSLADDIVVATTSNAMDDPIVMLARREHVGCFRGSEEDVLARYAGAARAAQAEVVVRITADCPLIDPEVTDRVISELIQHARDCDYASNVLNRTYPRGLDCESFFSDTLFRVDRIAKTKVAREHVTSFIRNERPDLFLCRSVEDSHDNSDLRWTVDTQQDFDFVKQVYEALNISASQTSYREILNYLHNNADVIRLDQKGITWDPTH
jgi:spore coat polysaccharide biosynthesis protein SpsF